MDKLEVQRVIVTNRIIHMELIADDIPVGVCFIFYNEDTSVLPTYIFKNPNGHIWSFLELNIIRARSQVLAMRIINDKEEYT